MAILEAEGTGNPIQPDGKFFFGLNYLNHF